MNTPDSTAPLAPLVEHADSSDDEDVSYTLEECIESWFFNKQPSTRVAYKERIDQFRAWLRKNYKRDIDHRLKRKHIRLYLNSKSSTCSQLRAIIVVIKSLCRELKKRGVIPVDVSSGFSSGRQKPPKFERNISPDTVRAMFRVAQKKSSKQTMVLLQIAVYAGLRIGALSRLSCSDILKVEHNTGANTFQIRVRCAKGNKTRLVSIKSSIGRYIYEYAQSLNTIYLFPSSKKPGKPLGSQALSKRIKRIAKSIGKPQISAHFLRHFFATTACHAGMSVANIQFAMGHQSINTTGSYLHASKECVSSVIDLSLETGEDITLKHEKSELKKDLSEIEKK